MTAKSELMQAHEAMAKVLDAKFRNVPEWAAFRAIDRALLALEGERNAAASKPSQFKILPRPRPAGQHLSYMSLADQALAEFGKPISTVKLMEYISARRPLSGGDPAKARIVVQSSLSKDRRFRSVPWQGSKAWWYADRHVPAED